MCAYVCICLHVHTHNIQDGAFNAQFKGKRSHEEGSTWWCGLSLPPVASYLHTYLCHCLQLHHTYTLTYMHACMHARMRARAHTQTHTRTHTRTHHRCGHHWLPSLTCSVATRLRSEGGAWHVCDAHRMRKCGCVIYTMRSGLHPARGEGGQGASEFAGVHRGAPGKRARVIDGGDGLELVRLAAFMDACMHTNTHTCMHASLPACLPACLLACWLAFL